MTPLENLETEANRNPGATVTGPLHGRHFYEGLGRTWNVIELGGQSREAIIQCSEHLGGNEMRRACNKGRLNTDWGKAK